MGQQIIKQPDGKLCVWSTVTDSIIITDASAEELIEYYAEQAAEESRRQTRRVIGFVLADEPRKAYYRFAMTYDEAMEQNREENNE